MKVSPFIIFLTVAVIGCGQKESADPIDRVVRQESSNPMFFSGIHSIIRLPETASSEQLVPVAFKQAVLLGSVTKILETKKVQIDYRGVTNEGPDEYVAVLADSDVGRKVFLFQYDKGPGFTNKLDRGWIYQVYNE